MPNKFDKWSRSYQERKEKSKAQQEAHRDFLPLVNRSAKRAFASDWYDEARVIPYGMLNSEKSIIVAREHVENENVDKIVGKKWFYDIREDFDRNKVKAIQLWCVENGVKCRSINLVEKDGKTQIAFSLKRLRDAFHFKMVWA